MFQNKKFKLFISIFLFFAISGAVSIYSAPTTNAAAPQLLMNDKIYSDLSAHQHYWWLYGCFQTADIDKTTLKEVTSWDFFEGDSSYVNLGAMYGGGENTFAGDRKCSDEGVVKTAFNYLGFTSSQDTFCSIPGRQFGGEDVDAATCRVGAGEGDWDNKSEKSERAKWFKDNAEPKKPQLQPRAEYLRAYMSLMQGCSIKFDNDTLYSKAADVPGASADNKYAIPVVVKVGGTNKKPKLEVKYIQGIGIKSSASQIALVSNSSGAITFKTCNALLDILKSNADPYMASLESLGIDTTRNPSGSPLGDDEDCEGEDCPSATTCAVDNIGWIICPTMNFMAGIVDASYDVVANLLTVQPITTTTEGGKNMYEAWSAMRNVANVVFVIAFLIIIYSQITGGGFSNYGIKKMLPRIIIAAILVNISYWICAIAVDVSNIAGTSLKGLFDGIQQSLVKPDFGETSTGQDKGWVGLTVVLLGASGVLLMLGLSVLLPALIAAVFAIVTVFLVLTLRQALIILLIVIAPLAFVAYLLPNTESWFKKWLDLFKTLLFMFPIIAVIFGASALASQIVMTGATDKNGDGVFAVQVMGALITILPLAITPVVMKTAGGVLNRFGGFINNPNKGPFDRMRKGAEGYRGRKVTEMNNNAMNNGGRYSLRGRMLRRGAKRDAVNSAQEAEFKQAVAGYVAGEAENNQGFRSRLAKGGGEGADMRALAGAIQVQAKLTSEEVSAAKAVIENLNLPSSSLNEIAKGNNVAGLNLNAADSSTRRAAVQMALKKATVADAEDLVKSSGTMTSEQRQDLADGIVSSGLANKATHLGGKTLDDIAQGNVTDDNALDNAVAYHLNKGKYSAEALVAQDGAAADRVLRVAESGVSPDGTVIDLRQKAIIQENAEKVLDDARLNVRITSAQARQAVSKMAGRE